MRKIKKSVVVFILSIVCIFAFTGCNGLFRDPDDLGQGGQGVFENINLDAGSDYKGTLKVAYVNSDSEKRAMNAFIKSFNEKYPNITVVPTEINGGNYSASLLNVARSATSLGRYDQMYDVFWLSQDYLNSFYMSDILFPLGKVDAADKSFSTDDFVDLAKEVSCVNDTLYMMPRDYNQVVMYYNKDVFDAVDMTYPQSGMTRTEFSAMLEELAEKLKTASAKNAYGQYYRDMPYLVDCNICWDSLSWPFLKSFGSQVVDENGKVTFNSDETYNAIKYWKELIKKGYACQIGQGKSSSAKQFSMQNSAILFHARAVMTDVYEADLENDIHGVPNIGVAALPDFSDGGNYYVGAGSSGYAMYSNSVNPTAAWLFLKHIASVEGQSSFSKTGNCVPVLKSLLSDGNAEWRKWSEEKLQGDFDNDAFIYGIDGATTTRDFYKYIPVAAQTEVLNCIDEAFTNMIAETAARERGMIANAATKMTAAIAQAQ